MIEVNWNPDRSQLRQFALVWLVGFFLIGAFFALRNSGPAGDWSVPVVLWIAGAAVGLTGLAAPLWVRPVYLLWMGLAFPIGWTLSHLFLLVVFFAVFTPMAILFRLIGRDPLDRRGEGRGGFWIEKKEESRVDRYFRQF